MRDEDDATQELPSEYQDYADVFDEQKAGELPPLGGRTHGIDVLPGREPPYGPLYSLAAEELRVLREYLDNALRQGWIRRSTSPAGAPILFVPKKGGKLRLCVDYRGLNEVTVKNRAPLPLINEVLDRLGEAAIMTKLDLKDAYHRLRIREGDEWKTAFRCKYGHFEYLVMPFGLANAPATFQSYINDVLRPLVDTICVVYLDDILIYSRDPAEHSYHVRQVLQRLREAGLFANLKKCEFHTTRVSFLGFVVSSEGIQMERERVEAVATWPEPRSVKEVQTFLGFAGFYRRFIKNYSKITAPLTELTRKDYAASFQMSRAARVAFRLLRERF